jgi:hypothetical protein
MVGIRLARIIYVFFAMKRGVSELISIRSRSGKLHGPGR